jgi:hypothetical protein
MSDFSTPQGLAELQAMLGFVDQVAPLFAVAAPTPRPRSSSRPQVIVCLPCRNLGIVECDRLHRLDTTRAKACSRCKKKKVQCLTLDGVPLRRTKQFEERSALEDGAVSLLYLVYPPHPDVLTWM